MELTVDNDFQNNLDQETINSFVSHLAKARNENNTSHMPVNTHNSPFRQAVLKARHLLLQLEYTCTTYINWGRGWACLALRLARRKNESHEVCTPMSVLDPDLVTQQPFLNWRVRKHFPLLS